MTQISLIVAIVSYFKKVSKTCLENHFTILTLLGFDKKNKVNIDEILNARLKEDLGLELITVRDLIKIGTIPGDVQKQIRNVAIYKELIKQDPNEKKIFYVLNDEEKKIKPGRNIFKTQKEKESFVKSKDNKCEICSAEDNRMAIDHWRAYSVYNIDDKKIAVLLCETCNNIHHNVDASKILLKKKENLSVIENWISIESRIRKAGFYPNPEDMSSQIKNIKIVIEYIVEKIGKGSKLEHSLNTLCTSEQYV